MPKNRFDTEKLQELHFWVGPPDNLSHSQWDEALVTSRTALSDGLRVGGERSRAREEIDYLLGALGRDKEAAFENRRLDPNWAVDEGRVNARQRYARPLVALALNRVKP